MKQLGTFDPIRKDLMIDIESIKSWIGKGAQPSERVAKLAFKESGDAFFKKYYTEKTINKAVKNPDKYS